MSTPIRVHVVAGGFPPGKHAGHDIDYARMRILMALQSNEDVHTTVSSDFTDCHKWIRDAHSADLLRRRSICRRVPDRRDPRLAGRWRPLAGAARLHWR